MNKEDHDRTVEIARLSIHEYFDHYLSDVFPGQMGQLFESHNQDSDAHAPQFGIHVKTCPTRRRVSKALWMIAGGSAVAGALIGLLIDHAGAILRAIAG
jgi:hypothetical protein